MKKLLMISIALFISACAEESVNDPSNNTNKLSEPSNLEAVYTSAEYVDLTWEDNSTNESEFIIELRSQTTAWTTAGEVPQNTTQYRAAGLLDGVEYFFRVYARNQNSKSAPSDSTLVKTLKKLQPFQSKYMIETTDSLEMRLNGTKRGLSVIDKYYENGIYVIEEYTNVPSYNFEETIISKMHGETYNLISFVESLTQNSQTTVTTAVWDSLTVRVESGSKQHQRELDPGTVERTSFFYILNALPLETGYSRNLIMYFAKRDLIWNINLVVEGVETVQVPAGEFDTYHVVLYGTQPELHLFVDVETRRLVRMEIPTQGWEYLLLNE